MNVDARMWKAGALAVAATLIFALVVFRIADRVDRGTVFTKIVPQIVAGSRDGGATWYSTIIQIVNPAANTVSLSAAFYGSDGMPSTLTMKTDSAALPTLNGSFSSFSLPVNGQLIVATDMRPAADDTYRMVWGKFTSTAAITVGVTFEYRDADNTLLARAYISASESMTSSVAG